MLTSSWTAHRRLLAFSLALIIFALGAACASQKGETAPDFSLTGADNSQVSLAQLLGQHQSVALVFYRGFF